MRPAGRSLATPAISRVWQRCAMDATLIMAQKCLGKIKVVDLKFPELIFCAPWNQQLQSCVNTSPLSNALKSGVLGQHQQVFWQTVALGYNTKGRHCDWTITLVCHTSSIPRPFDALGKVRSQPVLLRFRQEDISQNLVETIVCPWLWESCCHTNGYC